MPWVHFHVAEKGMVKACCVGNIPLGNINESSFNDIWNGKPIQKLRDHFNTQQPDKRCGVCIKQELAGAKSIRQETWEKYENLTSFPQQADTLPNYFDIRFSNVCNYRCRTCWHGASSKWFKEAQYLKRTKETKAIIENITDFNAFILEFGPALKQAKEIYFAGGEPLVTEMHYLLLEWLIEHNITDCKLRYNTNFSVLTFKQFDAITLWRNFKSVEIMASIDAHDLLGEYIRKEMKWSQILTNREKIRPEKNIHFKISPTISILSVFHLPELYKNCIEKDLIDKDDIYFNILERPYYYNIKAFPEAQKIAIQNHYHSFFDWATEHKISDKTIQGFKDCLAYMFNEDLSKHWDAFLKETDIIDDCRDETIMLWWMQDLELM